MWNWQSPSAVDSVSTLFKLRSLAFSLSLSLSQYIYVCVCECVCVWLFVCMCVCVGLYKEHCPQNKRVGFSGYKTIKLHTRLVRAFVSLYQPTPFPLMKVIWSKHLSSFKKFCRVQNPFTLEELESNIGRRIFYISKQIVIIQQQL